MAIFDPIFAPKIQDGRSFSFFRTGRTKKPTIFEEHPLDDRRTFRIFGFHARNMKNSPMFNHRSLASKNIQPFRIHDFRPRIWVRRRSAEDHGGGPSRIGSLRQKSGVFFVSEKRRTLIHSFWKKGNNETKSHHTLSRIEE